MLQFACYMNYLFRTASPTIEGSEPVKLWCCTFFLYPSLHLEKIKEHSDSEYFYHFRLEMVCVELRVLVASIRVTFRQDVSKNRLVGKNTHH